MKKILIPLLFVCSLLNGQVYKIGGNDTILYDGDSPAGVIQLGKVYEPNFSLPDGLPTTNLLGYWSYSYGINADSTIYLVDANNNPVDTIDIVGLDWDITNDSLGIPFKTAAYLDWIGTPTIDTAFWNHSIFPTIVFQNVDYDSTSYFNIIQHRINSDSTELYPARIKEIAIYSTSSDAMDYFDVPTFTNPVWIDPYSGNDDTGDGTWALPFKTVVGVEAKSSLGAGRDIVVKSGYEYLTTYWGATDPYDWFAIGRFQMDAGSSNVILALGSNIDISNFILNGKALTYANQLQTSQTNITLNNCYGYGGAYFVRDYSTGAVLNQCVATHANFYRDQNATNTTTIDECYHAGISTGYLYANATAATAINHVITYTKSKNNGISINGSGTWKIKFNNFNNIFAATTGAYTGNIIIKGNTITPTLTSGKLIGTPNSSTVDYTWKVTNNNVTFAATYGCVFFVAVDQKNILLEDNIVDASGTNVDGAFAQINNPTVDNVSDTIRNNSYKRYYVSAQAAVIIGNENINGGDGNLNGSVVDGNEFILSGYYQDNPNSTHGIFISRNINCVVKNNYVEGSGIGIVFKSTAQEDSLGGAFYNVVKDCVGGILAKGYDSTKFYGNTIAMTKDYAGENYGIGLIYNTESDSTSDGCDVKNNIIYDATTTNAQTYTYLLDSLDNSINYNVVYSLNNSISSEEPAWNDWKLLGFDANSFNVTPNFTSSTQLWPIVQFNGTNLGATYDDGLDISTSWPTVVTKQQGATWQIGAYVQ